MLKLYKLLAVLSIPLTYIFVALKCLRDPSYRLHWRERFGYISRPVSRYPLWFHAVSAGETIAVAPLIQRLQESFPTTPILVTTATPTGHAEVRRRLGADVCHCYIPFDQPGPLRRFLKHIEPRVLILVETELWPLLLEYTRQRSIPSYLINGRLSVRSARGYARVRSLTQRMLTRLCGVACQYEDSAARFQQLGAPAANVQVLGSLKFDLHPPADSTQHIAEFREAWCADRPVWIAASTHVTEDEVVLAAHRQLRSQWPNLLLLVVPRHPMRATAVTQLAIQAGFETARFSEPPRHVAVVVVDQMGVLATLFGLADVAFIGGSLQGTGGHNPIEAAVHGTPMVMGPDRQNFIEITQQFAAVGGLTTITSAQTLAEAVRKLLADDALRTSQGRALRQVVERNQGSLQRHLDWLSERVKPFISRSDSSPS